MLTVNGIGPNRPDVVVDEKPRVAVIGAGPGGLAAAARLADAGVDVEVFEASNDLGGLARSIPLWGRQLELSAHIFRSSDDFVNRLWRDSAGELVEISLRRGIFDGKSVIEYPITPLRILRNLGFIETLKSVVGLIISRLTKPWKSKAQTAEEWMVNTYGKQLHNHFLKDYAEKLWGVACHKISASFPQFLFRSSTDSQEGEQSFFYPKKGNSAVWDTLGKKLDKQGVVIHRQTRVGGLKVEENKVTGLSADGKDFEFDHVISTMPLGLLARLALPEKSEVHAAASVLRARSTVLVYLQAKAGAHASFNWMSVYPSKFRLGRITDFGQWLDTSDGSTVYCLEYWCDRGDELWSKSDEDLAALATDELNEIQMVGEVRVTKSHVERIPGSHPVFSVESPAAIQTIKKSLVEIEGLSSVGRHGAHGVHGMGESMESARLVADEIILDLAS